MAKVFSKIAVVVVLLSSLSRLYAVVGDTTHVPVMDKYLWTWNGYQDRWAKMPDTTKTYEKILLRYKLTCPTGGCGEWDYTTGVVLRKHTGKLDSTLQDAPSFTVNGGVQDSVRISHDTTRSYAYNKTTKKTDSTANAPLLIRYFKDPNYAFKQTDSLYVWQAAYWNYIYDNTGKKIDSNWVGGDATFTVTKKKAYFVFEIIIPYELTRYITPYGKVFPKDWTRTWTMDVTDYAYLLHDSVELRSFYDGYSQGSLYTLSLDFIEGTPPRKTYYVQPIYNGYFTYGNDNDPINEHLPETRLFHDPKADLMTLRLIVSGHGSDKNGACEFIDKTHSIVVDGAEKYTQHLWREDCGQNYTYPQTGTYWFPRAGWCPGDLVYPWDYDISSFSKKGDSTSIEYRMEDYTSPNPSGGYNVNGVVFYSSGPSFTLDASIEDVEQPSSDPRFARTNPICGGASPIVVLRNNGSVKLTSVEIHYGIDGAEDHIYKWTGDLGFLQKTEVSLPAINLGGPGPHAFIARIGKLNNEATDLYVNNDKATSQYVAPTSYSNKIALALKIDRAPDNSGVSNDIRWELRDVSGAVMKEGSGYAEAQQVRDTFQLANGCYKFIIYDDGFGEGLMPWALGPGYANGNYSLRDDKNVYIINANSSNYLAEFGIREETTFYVGPNSSVSDKAKQQVDFTLYPNPGGAFVKVGLPTVLSSESVSLSVYDLLGKQILTRQIGAGMLGDVTLDFGNISEGSYIIRLESDSFKASKIYIKQ